MSLRNGLLGLLSQGPKTGFDLMREFDVGASVIWPAPKSEVYRVLAGLKAEGLIDQSAAGARNARTYSITDSGRAELAAWIAEPTDYSLRYDPILKAVFLRNADPTLRKARARADLQFFKAQLDILLEIEGRRSPEDPRGDARDMAIGLYRALIAWAEKIVAER